MHSFLRRERWKNRAIKSIRKSCGAPPGCSWQSPLLQDYRAKFGYANKPCSAKHNYKATKLLCGFREKRHLSVLHLPVYSLVTPGRTLIQRVTLPFLQCVFSKGLECALRVDLTGVLTQRVICFLPPLLLHHSTPREQGAQFFLLNRASQIWALFASAGVFISATL